MAGTINSLGIGSGILTSDVIDQLKSNDIALQVNPIDKKIELNQQKSQALDLLDSLLTSFKTNVSALDNDALYQERSVSGSNDGVSVTAEAGVAIQSFSVEVTSLAKASIQQSGSFGARTDLVASGAGTMNINIDGTNYAVDYDATTTLDDLKDAINSAAGTEITATILQTGDSAYSLIITSDATGKDQAISITDFGANLDSRLVSDAQVSGTFATTASKVAGVGTSGDMNINIAGADYQVAYNDTMTLQGLADAINADTGLSAVLSASIVEYGTNDYRLVMTPKSTAADEAITITDLGVGLDANLLNAAGTAVAGNLQTVQDARDASFKYNGIAMTRSSNEVTDIAVGMTISLLNDAGTANISIAQDRVKISDELSAMVTSYNTLMKQLDEMTLSNVDKGTVGIFNGDNTIKGIGREITKQIIAVNSDNLSLAQYGIGLNEDGTMTFSESEFNTMFGSDTDAGEAFFSGGYNDNSEFVGGVFTTLDALLDDYVGSSGFMTTLVSNSSSSTTSLRDERTRVLDLLNSRYDTMSARFASYDSMISRINNQFASLQQQIQMAVNSKN